MTTPDPLGHELDQRFRATLAGWRGASRALAAVPSLSDGGLTPAQLRQLFAAQVASRQLDLVTRHLGIAGWRVPSAGHEGNAAVAAALRPDDPALLHRRSGAFYCARAAQDTNAKVDAGLALLRATIGATTDTAAGGRYGGYGNPDLHLIPTGGTVAAHLPRSVGIAFAIERARRAARGRATRTLPQLPLPWPHDAVAVCTFGDGAVNHASAQAAFNTAGWADFTGLRLPLLLICEDNAQAPAARTTPGWVGAALNHKPGIRYYHADGCDIAETYAVTSSAVAWVRRHRRPAVLHLRTVLVLDGRDATTRRPTAEHDLALDPLVRTARLLVEAGLANPDDLLGDYDEAAWSLRRQAEQVLAEPVLATPAEVVAPLAPRRPLRVANTISRGADRAAGALAGRRTEAFAGQLPETAGPLTLAQAITAALTDAMLVHPQTLVFGPDVARTGGAHGVTTGLLERFGAARVFDTLPDETSTLGLALGAGISGLLPIPQLQSLSRLHAATDQLRAEGAAIRQRSQGRYRNPLLVRVSGLADGQSPTVDHSVAALRDIPGVVIGVPARADDAAAMLRTCVAAAEVDGTVAVMIEPTALYHARDLHSAGDQRWLAPYPGPDLWHETHVPVGRARVYPFGAADELTIITFGNGVPMALRAAARLLESGHGGRVVDLRWLAPLPIADLVREAAATGKVLLLDETRRTGGVAEGVLAALVDAGYVGLARRVAAVDTFLPPGDGARHVLISENAVLGAAAALLAG